jgi:hypothetical protein
MAATVLGVDHTGITVSHLDQSVKLWRDVPSLFAYAHDPDGVTLELIQLAPIQPDRPGGQL